jgi:hypothetical protein
MKPFLIDGLLLALPLVPLAAWKVFTLPPKVGRIKDLYHTLDWHRRTNRKGVDVKPQEAYAWVPRSAESKRVLMLPGRMV